MPHEKGRLIMSKLLSLVLAGAIATGGATVATTLVGSSTPALACSANAAGGPQHRYADSLPTLRYGNHGTEVLGLQLYLRQEGRTYLNGTGYFGDNTRKAVRHFQARNNLPVTGVVNRATWRKVISNQWHVPVPDYPNPQLSPGASLNNRRGDNLANMTVRLGGLPWFDAYGDNTVYSGGLLRSVKEFQRRVGLQGTGVFGARTTNRMNTVIAIAGDWGC